MKAQKALESSGPADAAVVFLEEVLPSESKHYLWLRSLSYLEYIGYRKMVKSLGYEGIDRGVFHHLSDEIQHSYMLRELADKRFTGLSAEATFTEGFQEIAEDYFQNIDARVEDWVNRTFYPGNHYLCYLLTSYLIERRAMRVYPQYYHFLGELPSKSIIQKIIKDESEHLGYIEGVLKDHPVLQSADLGELFAFEDECFSRFLGQLQDKFNGLGIHD